jgi:hypothetical protein
MGVGKFLRLGPIGAGKKGFDGLPCCADEPLDRLRLLGAELETAFQVDLPISQRLSCLIEPLHDWKF